MGDDVARVPMNTEALEAAPSADEDDLVEPQGRKARRRRFASLSSTTTTTPSRSNSAPTPCCPRCAPGSPTSDPTRAPPLPPMRWCGQHFADQKRQLMKIADMERGEVYELSLSKVCIRRETSGADELADHLLQHGLTKDGKLAISPPPLPGGQPPRGMSIKWLERCHKHRCRSTDTAIEEIHDTTIRQADRSKAKSPARTAGTCSTSVRLARAVAYAAPKRSAMPCRRRVVKSRLVTSIAVSSTGGSRERTLRIDRLPMPRSPAGACRFHDSRCFVG
jgi:hypothetical protein